MPMSLPAATATTVAAATAGRRGSRGGGRKGLTWKISSVKKNKEYFQTSWMKKNNKEINVSILVLVVYFFLVTVSVFIFKHIFGTNINQLKVSL